MTPRPFDWPCLISKNFRRRALFGVIPKAGLGQRAKSCAQIPRDSPAAWQVDFGNQPNWSPGRDGVAPSCAAPRRSHLSLFQGSSGRQSVVLSPANGWLRIHSHGSKPQSVYPKHSMRHAWGFCTFPPLAASLSSSRATISHCRSGCCCFICTPTAQTAGMRWCLSPLLEAVSPHRQGSEQVWRTTSPCFTPTVCINCRLLPLTVRLQDPACSRSSGSSSDSAVVRPT